MRKLLGDVQAIAVVIGIFAAYVAARVVFALLAQESPVPVFVAFVAALVVGVTVTLVRARRSRHRIEQWQATGWELQPEPRVWPWDGLLRDPSLVTVKRYWTRAVDGLPVTVGEIDWRDNAFAGGVNKWDGPGLCVVVQLPQPTEAMAMRRILTPVGTSHRLGLPAMIAAFVAQEIPPWTADGDELFIVEAYDDWLTPEKIERSVRRALLTVRLLDLGADRSATGDFAVVAE